MRTLPIYPCRPWLVSQHGEERGRPTRQLRYVCETTLEAGFGEETMTSAELSHRPLARIAEDILTDSDGRLPMRARAHIEAMARLPSVENDEGYQVTAKVRSFPLAPHIKHELEAILAHYRAKRW